ncbi:KAP family NTPase [Christensenellaceae bacterium OttesenSCG-928-M15]|nr:KAP family NTPase [Christensenellaceae bacterium OttesenSCG-928-M15]
MTHIGSTDQPATTDMFGIENYISGLCSFITDCDTPMTIAIQGDWGSGKTSVMEMIRDSIDGKGVRCVWFNTWQFSQFNTGDGLSLALIEAIIKGFQLDEEGPAGDLRAGIKRLGAVMANVGKRALYAGSEMLLGGTNAEDLRKKLEEDPSPTFSSLNETISNLKIRFQECVNDALKPSDKQPNGVLKPPVNRILVFIDDLDRLQPLRAVELLEVLKIFLDCENCVFVLALDYNVVVSGVKQKYGADFKADKGRSFFDKIIQVPFKMPIAQYNISSFVKKMFEDVANLQCDDQEVKNFVSLINSSIGSNPRSMKRLFNSYLLLLKVMNQEIKDRDDKIALFSILCMQQSFESLYNFIVVNREDLEVVNAELFTRLADPDAPETIFRDEGIDIEDGEAEKIKAFMACFNQMLTCAGAELIDEANVDKLRALLKNSSITTTEATPVTTKIRPTFLYKGNSYMPKGANRMNLGNLALRLVMDFAKETEQTADELVAMVNTQVPCYYSHLKRAGLGQLALSSHPSLRKKELRSSYFSEKKEIIRLGDVEFLVIKGWGVEELLTLISLLGYGDRITSNIDLR